MENIPTGNGSIEIRLNGELMMKSEPGQGSSVPYGLDHGLLSQQTCYKGHASYDKGNAIETLAPTGPAETLQSLESNLLDHQEPQLIEEDASQFTPCDCGECFNCLADELSDQDQETCPECERYLTFCTCDPYCGEDYFDSEDEFGGDE